MIAGGVESMSRAPFVMGKAESAFSRAAKIEDTTIGWPLRNALMKAQYGVDSMPETGENVAAEYGINRADQDRMALASQMKAIAAQQSGFFDSEIRASDHHPEKRRSNHRQQRRAPACHLARSTGKTQTHRQSGRARSPPAMPPASMTAPAHCCWQRSLRCKIQPGTEGTYRRHGDRRASRRA